MVVLPAPDGPTRATSWPGSAMKLTSNRTWWETVVSRTATDSSEARETSSARRVAEVDVVELDPGRPGGNGSGVGLVGDHRGQVEHLEDPVEGDQRGHHVDLHVGQRGERAVEAGEVGGQRHHRADLEGAVHHLDAAPAVDHGGGQRGGQGQGGDEEAGVHGLGDPDVPDPAGLGLEGLPLLAGPAEQLDQQGPRHVEPLVHGVVHLGVEAVRLAGDWLQPAAHPLGRKHEDRQDDEADQGDLPRQEEHHDEHQGHADQVGDHR